MDREELLNKLGEVGYDPEDFEDDTEDVLLDVLQDVLQQDIDAAPENWSCWEQCLEEFREESLITKEQVLQAMKKMRESCADDLFAGHSASYIKTLNGILDEFYEKILSANFPEPLPDFWQYRFSVSIHRAELSLVKMKYSFTIDEDLEGQLRWIDITDVYKLISIPVRKLTVNEYAALYGVEPVTVRQWIRRGRIRSAEKVQKEWLISELTDLPQERGYLSGGYEWMPPLQKLPEEFAYLNRFSFAWFEKDKNAYKVELSDEDLCRAEYDQATEKYFQNYDPSAALPEYRDTTYETLTLSAAEREKLERFMIESDEIAFFDRGILSYRSSSFISVGSESYYENNDSDIVKPEVVQTGERSESKDPVSEHEGSD